jgi:hypothetical protein
MFKEVYKCANKKISIKSELVENTESKANEQLKDISEKRKSFFGYGRVAIPICLGIVLCIIVSIPHVLNDDGSKNTHLLRNGPLISIRNDENSIGTIKNGVNMHQFYRYNGNYYLLKDASPNIQENISKHLYGDFYEIKGVDTSKSIALFINNYYYLLDYAFKDTVTFNGKPYLINAATDTPGKYLGDADKYKIYEMPGSDIAEGILVKIGNFYYIAYQYLSSVKLMGITYELEPYKQNIDKNNVEEYINMAGPYKAYRYDKNDINKTIMIHINDTEEVMANSTVINGEDQLPVSNYGSPEESMYPLLETVQWENHGIYLLGSQGESDSLKKQLGQQIDNYNYEGYNYEIYEMKGVDTSKCIIIKNNQVYLKYYFMFTDTINFNGKTYVIGDGNAGYIKGSQIGMFGSNKVYEIKGEDSDKVIDVFMSGSAEGMSLQSDFTAYRQDK